MKKNNVIALLSGVVLILLSAGAAFGLVPDGHHTAKAENSIANIPLAGRYAISAAIGLDQQKFHGIPGGEGIEMLNPSHNLSARFNENGLRVYRNGQEFGLRLEGYGYGDHLQPIANVAPVSAKNRVEFEHGTLTEWYVNGPLGLQQGFTLEEAPLKTCFGNCRLSLVLTMQGNLKADVLENGSSLLLADAYGKAVLRYSGLLVYDAAGREFPAQLRTRGDNLVITLDDTGARYPLTIDPIFEDAVLSHDDETGEAYAYLGMAVAVSGDTVVVGAPDAGTSNEGKAYVFVKTGSSWADMVQTQELSKGNTEDFGAAVAISGDTLVVGDPLADVDPGPAIDCGLASVFYKEGASWVRGRTLIAGDRASDDEFGNAVAISGDTIVVGAHKNDTSVGGSNHGRAYVFVRPVDGWGGAFLSPAATLDDPIIGLNQMGTSVAVDGDTVVVGSPDGNYPDSGAGFAEVFEKPGSGWSSVVLPTAYLFSSDRESSDYLGTSVAISGETVVVGAPYHDTDGDGNEEAVVTNGHHRAWGPYFIVDMADGPATIPNTG